MTGLAERHQADVLTRIRLRTLLTELLHCRPDEIRVTSVHWGDGLRWCVLALTRADAVRRREIHLTRGALHQAVADLLKGAFPDARWDRALDYDVASGVLREHITRLPDCLREDVP